MTRKIIAAFLALLLCVSLTVSVCAVPAEVSFVVDELGCLTEDERSDLNDLAASIYTQTGVGVFFAYAQTESVEDYDVGTVVGDITDYVLMLENETHWYIHLGGEGQIIDLDAEELLRAAYDAPPTYYEGVAAYMEATAEYFPQIPDAAEGGDDSAADAAGKGPQCLPCHSPGHPAPPGSNSPQRRHSAFRHGIPLKPHRHSDRGPADCQIGAPAEARKKIRHQPAEAEFLHRSDSR